IAYADIFFNPNRANHATEGVDIPFNELLPIEDPFSFYLHSPTVYKKVGFGAEISGIPIPVIFENHDVIYPLPLNYGQVHSSYSNYNIDVPTLAYYGYQQVRHLEVDGWGSITTPAGTFDVLRVKTRVEAHDSIMVDQLGTGFGIDRPTVREYKWLAQGIRVPVLQINTVEIFGTEIVTEIYFYDEERTLQIAPPIAESLCPGSQVPVEYSATGVFNSGGFLQQANIFRAQLSDANGSFANPVNIGQVTSTTSGTITATIPAGTVPGSGYRIRVISTDPAFVGEDNGFDISIGTAPVAQISAGGPLEFCAGEHVVLQASELPGATYQWMLNNEPIENATGSVHLTFVSGDLSVAITSACGVSTSEVITVSVIEPPVHMLDQEEYTSCDGTPVNIIATNNTGATSLEYEWFMNGNLIEGENGSELIASISGEYHVVATNTDNGCSFTTSAGMVVIEEATMPQINADGNTTFCEGGMVTLTASGSEGSNYQWHLNGSPIDGATGSELMVTSIGAYSATATTSGGCTSAASASIIVSVNSIPETAVLEANGETTICDGYPVQLSTEEVQGVEYSWTLNGAPIQNENTSSIDAGAAGTYAVIASLGECSAASSNMIEVMVNPTPAPVVMAAGPVAFCEGGNVELSVDVAPGSSVQWTVFSGAIEGATETTLTVNTSGPYSVIVT
nr:hypothetical protein [Bacteroidota bacterium]